MGLPEASGRRSSETVFGNEAMNGVQFTRTRPVDSDGTYLFLQHLLRCACLLTCPHSQDVRLLRSGLRGLNRRASRAESGDKRISHHHDLPKIADFG